MEAVVEAVVEAAALEAAQAVAVALVAAQAVAVAPTANPSNPAPGRAPLSPGWLVFRLDLVGTARIPPPPYQGHRPAGRDPDRTCQPQGTQGQGRAGEVGDLRRSSLLRGQQRPARRLGNHQGEYQAGHPTRLLIRNAHFGPSEGRRAGFMSRRSPTAENPKPAGARLTGFYTKSCGE